MKGLFVKWCGWVLGLLVLMPALATADEWAKKMFDTTRHDFGAVARGATVQYEFKLRNLYQETAHVAGVQSSCGCTTPKITKDTLKTYEDGSIIAELNTHLFSGHKSATITVTFDKPFYAEVQLHVEGYIRTDVVLTPGGIDFGTVDLGATPNRKLVLAYSGRSDWKVVEVRGGEHVDATLVETSRGGGQVNYELSVALKSSTPAGYLKEQLTLITNDSSGSEVPVEIQARVTPPVTVNPSALFLGVLDPGQKVTKQVVVQAKKPFKITGIRCDDEAFQFLTNDQAKTVHLVPVTFTAGSQTGKLVRKIHIVTDLGPDGEQDLSAYVQVRGPKAE